MAHLYGRDYSREDLLRLVGDISQVAGVRMAELADGAERSVRIADFRTGSGLAFTLLVDRGMDIAWSSYKGASLEWRSPTGVIAPAFFEPEELGWLRGFYGGLLLTCGLTYFGAPTVDQEQSLGLHGRASFLPASKVSISEEWAGDEFEMAATGILREAAVHGENLTLRRRLSARLGESVVRIRDTVKNEGYRPTPHMLLYHVNLGFPIAAPESRLLLTSCDIRPRTDAAASGLGQETRLQPPTRGYAEQVFYHQLVADADGYAAVALVNPAYENGQGIGLYLKYRMQELPWFVEWKMMGEGTYVFGLAPATNLNDGRARERAEGRLRYLEPGETREYILELGILSGGSEIDRFAAALPQP